jgi:hypothetical protein
MHELLRPNWRVFTNKRTWYLAQCALVCGVLSIAFFAAQDRDHAIPSSFFTVVCAALMRDRIKRAKEEGGW